MRLKGYDRNKLPDMAKEATKNSLKIHFYLFLWVGIKDFGRMR